MVGSILTETFLQKGLKVLDIHILGKERKAIGVVQLKRWRGLKKRDVFIIRQMGLHVINNIWMKWKEFQPKIYGLIFLLSIPKLRSVSITPLKSLKPFWNVSSRHRPMKECLWLTSSEAAA